MFKPTKSSTHPQFRSPVASQIAKAARATVAIASIASCALSLGVATAQADGKGSYLTCQLMEQACENRGASIASAPTPYQYAYAYTADSCQSYLTAATASGQWPAMPDGQPELLCNNRVSNNPDLN